MFYSPIPRIFNCISSYIEKAMIAQACFSFESFPAVYFSKAFESSLYGLFQSGASPNTSNPTRSTILFSIASHGTKIPLSDIQNCNLSIIVSFLMTKLRDV